MSYITEEDDTEGSNGVNVWDPIHLLLRLVYSGSHLDHVTTGNAEFDVNPFGTISFARAAANCCCRRTERLYTAGTSSDVFI